MSVTLALLAAHSLADFPLQTDRMAQQKFDSVEFRFRHAVVHHGLTLAFLWPLLPFDTAWLASVLVAALHFLIDTKRWADPKDGFGAYPIAVDQSLHIASLYLVSVVVL